MSNNNTRPTASSDHANYGTADDWMLGVGTGNKNADQNNGDNADIKEQAEQQLIHALLQTIYEDKKLAAQQHEVRMTSILTAITTRKTSLTSRLVTQAWRLPGWFGVAASLCLFVLTLSFWLTPSNIALAEVHKLLDGLALLQDKAYQVSVTPVSAQQTANISNLAPKASTQMFDKDISANEPSNKHKTSAASWLDGASLYIRGDKQYLLEAETPQGALLRGRNESTSWKLGHNNTVKVYQDYNKIKLPFAGDAVALAFVNLSVLLEKLTKNYQLAYKASNTASSTDQSLSVITAIKKSPKIKGVKQITVFYQPDSYLIERIEFDRVHIQGNPERYQINLQLISTSALDVDLFNPEYHLETLDISNGE